MKHALYTLTGLAVLAALPVWLPALIVGMILYGLYGIGRSLLDPDFGRHDDWGPR